MEFRIMTESKILKGIDQIRTAINPANPLGKNTVIDLIRHGMPVNMIGNTYYAHIDNIDRWFRENTNVNMAKASDEILERGE